MLQTPSVLTTEIFETFVRESSGKVYATIRRIVRNEADAEDVLQESLLAAWRSRDGFDGRSNMSTWIHRIAVNCALNKVRKIKTQTARITSEIALDQAPETKPADDPLLRDLVWSAIDRLPDDQRLVLVLRDVEVMNSKEIADHLGISPDAVRQRLHRARQTLAEELRPELCGAEGMTCGGRIDLLLDLIDGELSESTQAAVTAHIAGCTSCQTYSDGYRNLMALPASTAEEFALPPKHVVEAILRLMSK